MLTVFFTCDSSFYIDVILGSSSSDEDHNDNDENHNMCPICLGEFTDQMVGIPENCVHMFCIECIQEWTKVNFTVHIFFIAKAYL